MAARAPALWLITLAAVASAQPESGPPRFHVKQVAEDSVYIDAGAAAGLREGMTLSLKRRKPGEARMAELPVAEVMVVSVATQSALCEVRRRTLEPAVGDEAELSIPDAVALTRARIAEGRRRYAQVISFTAASDPLEEEVREYVPHPPLREEGRLRGRIGFELTTLTDRSGAGSSFAQEGAAVRVDWTRIGGSYWSLSGYWRGRITSNRGAGQQTINDLLNRTYHLGLFYNDPRSPYEFGFGRLLLPWATTLSTLDGGYAARHMRHGITLGLFAGTTPDPTQWNYDPTRQMAGLFTAFEKGSYDSIRWTTTVGAAFTRAQSQPERQFLFLENTLYAHNKFSILHSLEADRRNPRLMNGATGAQLSRNYLTLRYQPHSRFAFDVNHNYFRGIPTFDMRLIGTGLVDKLLFQGLSAGVRVEPIRRLMLTIDLGRTKRESDAKASLNQQYAAAWTGLPWIGGRIEGRYSRFASSFGDGGYQAMFWMRELGTLRFELQAGEQSLRSAFTSQSRTRFVNSQLDWNFSARYFLSGGWMAYRGVVQNYDMLFFTLGYRFE